MKNFTIIKPTTQRGQAIIEAYKNSTITTLNQAYPTHHSSEKAHAFKRCTEIMEEHDGHGMRITGASTYQFSCACKANYDGKSGLIYFTAKRNYFIPMGEAEERISADEFEKRWTENVTEDIKERTARALGGHTITSMEEAVSILKMAEAFSAMQRLFEEPKANNEDEERR